MGIRPEEIDGKPKKIGKLGDAPVMLMTLKGGLNLVLAVRGGKAETLGAGPHPAVARHIAKKRTDGKVEWTDLSKSDWVDPAHFEHVLPKYEDLTDALRARQGL